MTITFIGHGYVGLVTAAIFADLGNKVYVIGHTKEKVDNLNNGILPIYEPGLEEIVKRNLAAGRIIFTLDYQPAIPESEIVFTAVGTPPKESGEADLTAVLEVIESIGKNLAEYTVVATKSTVPVGTNKKVREVLQRVAPQGAEYDIASVPEFLREGSAISDTLHPDRIVIGTDSERAQKKLLELHEPIDGERVLTNLETAELIKYAANSFLATKISFANAIAELAELSGADAVKVLEGIGYDRRIGKMFLNAGCGYGGSCFPKDVQALIAIAQGYGYDFALLKDVEEINKRSKEAIITKAQKMLGDVKGKKIGIWGLAFKPDTDDMRAASSITIINALKEQGAEITAYDPIALHTAQKVIQGITFAEKAEDAAKGADLLILVTEWNEFKEADMENIATLMNTQNLIDGRNIYNPEKMRELGFNYKGVGR